MKEVFVPLIIISLIIAIFTILIIIIYCKGESFKSYPCYFNIFFCIAITLDNFLRLFQLSPGREDGEGSALCWMQAILLSFFDKIILNSITIYSIIHFLGIHMQIFYEKYLKAIYILLVIINICLSSLLTLIFALQGLSLTSEVCYIHTKNPTKKIIDTIYTCILLFIDLICISLIIYGVCKLSRNYRESQEARKISATRKYICRFIFDLIINIITFGYILLLINKMVFFIDDEHKYYKDIIYICLCLMIELFFTLNSELSKELMRLLTCNKVERFKKKERPEEEAISDTEEVENEEMY
jgi:hypothetical protein